MKLSHPAFSLARLLPVVLLIAAVSGCNAQSRSTGSATQQKIADLKQLRNTGVLSQDEYDQKVAALRSGPAHSETVSSAPAHTGSVKGPGAPTVDHKLMDQAWGLPWGTVKLPPGWSFNGGVVHAGTKGCAASGDSPMWAGESADHLYGIAILPMLKTNASTDPQMQHILQQSNCPMVSSVKAADYLTKFVIPHFHKNFQVIGSGPEPLLAQMVEQTRQQTAQFDRASGGGQFIQSHHEVDSARVLLTYDVDGHKVNEVAMAATACTVTTMRMPALRGPAAPTQTVECSALATMLVHQPDDGTPFTMAAIGEQEKSGKQDSFFKMEQSPAWQQRFNQAAQATSQSLQAENQQRQQSTQSTASNQQSEFAKQQAARQSVTDYSRQVHNNVYNNQQAANAQVNGAYAAHMGDYNVYSNPNTGQQVQLSNQYNNTYVNSQGNTAVQTNSASSPGADWTQMVPKY